MNQSSSSPAWMLWVAILALLIGVGIGLAALTASLGVWLGLWTFGTGFQILGAVNPYTGWVAVVCLVDAITLLALAQLWKTGTSVKLFSLAFIGALAASMAWYIPTTFRAPEGETYPPIHDVSTDIVNPVEYVDILPLRADAPNTVVYGGSPNMTPERLAELQTEAFPDLVPRLLDATPDEVFERALAAVDAMGWELVAAVPEEGRIEATATTFWFRFKDDVVIRIRPEGDQTRIDARSLSRVGGGDAGTNAKRLRAFFEIL
ncbi:DUF1499 domain-containing protein [Gammaproteobacteria bacterium]|nr:DUF1499 domain-containing protein [Gammaproteobacteria bacterium]